MGNNQNFDHIFGAPGRGEYALGQIITFQENGQEYTGEVIHITAPGQTVGGRQLPTTYEVDCGDGFPHIVLASQIIERTNNILVECPYCGQHHPAGQIEQCPLKRREER